MYDVNDDDQFTNQEKMFVPLTIDDLEMESQNYFFSGKKFIIASLSLLPYITIFFFLDYIPNIQVFIIYTIAYLIGYSYILRFAVFEESRQKEQMKELENNKYSDLSYFWQLDKVGAGKRDNGMLYIQSNGLSVRRAFIIEVDSGSTIGVPANAYANYRQVWQRFFRSCYRMGFELKIYNVRKKPELSESLKAYSLQLQDIENEAYRNLMQLNVETNFLYAVSEEQRYITYIEVINSRVDNLVNFKTLVEDIISKTFETDGLFSNPKILTKSGVDNMLATYFAQDRVNTRGIHRTNGYQRITEYADIVNIWDNSGHSVPFEMLDNVERESSKIGSANNKTLDDLLDQQAGEDNKWADKVEETKRQRISEIQRLRREEKISYEEYEERRAKIEEVLNPETATEFDLLDEKSQRSRIRQREKELEKEKRKNNRNKNKTSEEESTVKWYEQDDELLNSVDEELLTGDETRYDRDIEVDIGNLTIEDLLNLGERDDDE